MERTKQNKNSPVFIRRKEGRTSSFPGRLSPSSVQRTHPLLCRTAPSLSLSPPSSLGGASLSFLEPQRLSLGPSGSENGAIAPHLPFKVELPSMNPWPFILQRAPGAGHLQSILLSGVKPLPVIISSHAFLGVARNPWVQEVVLALLRKHPGARWGRQINL